MLAYKCDKCGKFFTTTDRMKLAMGKPDDLYWHNHDDAIDYDLCQTCYDDIVNFITPEKEENK